MSPLQSVLAAYRAKSQSQKEKGSYFEELIRTCFRNEPRFADLYSDVEAGKKRNKDENQLLGGETRIRLVA